MGYSISNTKEGGQDHRPIFTVALVDAVACAGNMFAAVIIIIHAHLVAAFVVTGVPVIVKGFVQ